nr:hypothetical protein [Bacteroidota bacterium]
MKYLSLFIISIIGSTLFGQQNELYQKALAFKNESKFELALPIFQQLLKSDSGNVDYLHNTSFLYSKLGFRQKPKPNNRSGTVLQSILVRKPLPRMIKVPMHIIRMRLHLDVLTKMPVAK